MYLCKHWYFHIFPQYHVRGTYASVVIGANTANQTDYIDFHFSTLLENLQKLFQQNCGPEYLVEVFYPVIFHIHCVCVGCFNVWLHDFRPLGLF